MLASYFVIDITEATVLQVLYIGIVLLALALDRKRYSGKVVTRHYTYVGVWFFVTVVLTAVIVFLVDNNIDTKEFGGGWYVNSGVVYIVFILVSFAATTMLIFTTGNLSGSTVSPALFTLAPILVFLNAPIWIVVLVLLLSVSVVVYDSLKKSRSDYTPVGLRRITVICMVFTVGVGLYAHWELEDNASDVEPDDQLQWGYLHSQVDMLEDVKSQRGWMQGFRGDSVAIQDSVVGKWRMVMFNNKSVFVQEEYLYMFPPAERFAVVVLPNRFGRVVVREGRGRGTKDLFRIDTGDRVWVETMDSAWVQVFRGRNASASMGFIRGDLLDRAN